MSRYPTTFAEKVKPLDEVDLGERGNAARAKLAEKGFDVVAGLTPFYAGALATLAIQPHIEAYCPNDLTRFSEGDVEGWLEGGRGVFVLRKNVSHVANSDVQRKIPVGWGWMGEKTNKHVPGAEDTFAVRIGSTGLRQGAAAPFTEVIVAGAAVLHDARTPWLEAYGDNPRALGPYWEAGFVEETRQPANRPLRGGVEIATERVYARFNTDLLPPVPA